VIDLTSRPPLAGILVRFAAILVDGVVPLAISIPSAIVFWLVLTMPNLRGDTMEIVAIFIALLTLVGLACYSATMLGMWAYGLTPGKWMLGIRVVKRETGQPAGFWRMALRETVGKLISGILCYLGYIWALVDSNRQAWHDKIAKTLVIRTR
jgi:uncharacterized RDD family membrane protein YckC